ncbi:MULTISPECIES: pilus assembly protein TadG-related protein [unclassified Pseudomonas]|uniref:pilus assembly protein TadG-related protein n=1 Tax=unclassified Pseudomonas TaxID=196821 RepID=UPI00087738F1|nr:MULTISPECIES: pilus assembly protein TadG-related protein [unclassified Pseudomonas]SCZ73605.1 Putative Flp pilus-assembly TadE/G-like [Pseudomonas sp. NFPP17]SDA79618.1 Putative Flp pilus-assembly TadE/G-like [Pseudomonas sp. NFPP15]SEL48600.1 Putative Flp pilus-assembly TadE/G-like [Pseudomonas sp. NFPP18]SFA65378.1 Putative Flp pilus-assembly TadE/G-like [Pseudomonas sp. NFPP13]SFU00378.1 Putative Flp pilus-assembly TadE/G-like [Pseudomonas sp. NFPP25]
MSPLKRFYGPARQRGAIGLMAAVTFGLALLLMLLVVDSGRLYMEQRKLQRVADNAALEAVSRGGTCQAGLTAAAYAGQNATRNGFTVATGSSLSTSCGSLTTGANGLRTFTANPAQAVAIRVIATHTVPISVASGVAALFTPGPINLTTQLSATAVAAAPTPTVAQLSIRSTLGTVSTAQSSILNPLVGGMMGGSLSLSAVGWNGLLNTNINLLSYLNQLAINLGVAAGNYTQLLNTTTSVTQLIQAAITVVQANGATADILTALGNLQVAAINAAPLKLGDILQLQTGLPSTALDANLQLFQLLQAVIQLSNSNSAVAATLPINVLGLANITVQAKVIEPPQLSAIGNPALAKADPMGANRIYVRTAQVRTMVRVNLSLPLVSGLSTAVGNLVAPLTPVLNSLLSLNLVATLGSALCLLGAGCEQLYPAIASSSEIDLSLDAGGAIAYVTDYSCPVNNSGTKSLTAHAISSIADLKVGQIDPANAFSSAAEPVVKPLPLVDLGIRTCYQFLVLPGRCDPVVHYAGGGIAVMVNTSVAQNTQDLVFSSSASPFPIPPNVNQTPTYQTAAPTTNIVNSLAGTLAGINLIVYKPVNNNPLGAIVTGLASAISGVSNLLTPLITGLLSPLLDPLLNNLLSGLGINLMDVEVGANLTCGQTGKAYLVI